MAASSRCGSFASSTSASSASSAGGVAGPERCSCSRCVRGFPWLGPLLHLRPVGSAAVRWELVPALVGSSASSEAYRPRVSPVARTGSAQNNGLHQTGRGGAAGFPRCRPVIEARPAGEAGCCTERGTDRRAFVPPPSAVADAPSDLPRENVPSMGGHGQALQQSRSSMGPRPDILQHPLGAASTISFPSAPSWLGANGQTTNSGFPVVAPMPGEARPYNNALQRTGREGAALLLRRRPDVEARPAAERECSTLIEVATTTLRDERPHQYSALSAFERRGRQPRSRAPSSRCGWSGVQPRQRARSRCPRREAVTHSGKAPRLVGEGFFWFQEGEAISLGQGLPPRSPGRPGPTRIPAHRPATKVD